MPIVGASKRQRVPRRAVEDRQAEPSRLQDQPDPAQLAWVSSPVHVCVIAPSEPTPAWLNSASLSYDDGNSFSVR